MNSRLTNDLYDAFQKGQIDRWDELIDDDVLTNSPGALGIQGRTPLKAWAQNFVKLAHRIDLVDEHLALDQSGNGRGFITFTLHWKHAENFLGVAPTGREGTSVETLILTIRDSKVVRIDVADNSLDLVLYMWQRGWPYPHNWRPKPIVTGVTLES